MLEFFIFWLLAILVIAFAIKNLEIGADVDPETGLPISDEEETQEVVEFYW
jgi:hypothetical protein